MANQGSEVRKIIKSLEAQGFDVCKVKSGHWKVTAPDHLGGQKCQIAATPREYRGVLNIITRLKRIGYVPETKFK